MIIISLLKRISANTPIYQSVPALVFILSIPVLKEIIMLTKLLSVAFTIVGGVSRVTV